MVVTVGCSQDSGEIKEILGLIYKGSIGQEILYKVVIVLDNSITYLKLLIK
jgi:hypothetical protein